MASDQQHDDGAVALPSADTPALAVRGLVKRYSKHEAVRGIDFEVQQGEIFGLLGPNGAGKTTTIEIIVGLRAPTEGRVEIFGTDVTREPAGRVHCSGSSCRSPTSTSTSNSRSSSTTSARAMGASRTASHCWGTSASRTARSGG